jgi:prevent-host-death family protein
METSMLYYRQVSTVQARKELCKIVDSVARGDEIVAVAKHGEGKVLIIPMKLYASLRAVMKS